MFVQTPISIAFMPAAKKDKDLRPSIAAIQVNAIHNGSFHSGDGKKEAQLSPGFR